MVACKNCQQDSWVTIGSKKYCTNCGSLQKADTIVGSAFAVSGPNEVIKDDATTTSFSGRPAKPVAAQSLHGTTALAAGGVLDLRKPTTPKPAAPTVTKPASFTDIAPKPQTTPAPVAPPADPILVVAPQPSPPTPTPVAQPKPVAPPLPQKPQPSIKEMAEQLSSPAENVATAEAKLAKNRLKKPAGVAAAALVVVIMGGYIWANNYNNLSIRTASQRAGIVASLPHYTPTDYKLSGPIAYGTGFVSFNLKNSKDSNKSIAVIQRKSDWDSASLLELYVSPKTKNYVAVNDRGLKIYLYDNGKATWVNKGLQYVVQADSSLSRDQIVKLAGSL